ncbi:uncharacterized protein LOC110932940 [Helianthus annuus]|uniref:uncharacterized protein LOC110932940 n=1 Tax=Helianthus annuus TaxID=4232 RepID=UPI000B905DA0|nr:uncharacterized protein LOC110932940 [Helianthus annuus]
MLGLKPYALNKDWCSVRGLIANPASAWFDQQEEEGDPHSQYPNNSLISQIEGSNQVKIKNRAWIIDPHHKRITRSRVFKRTNRSGHALEGNALKVIAKSARMKNKLDEEPNTITYKLPRDVSLYLLNDEFNYIKLYSFEML